MKLILNISPARTAMILGWTVFLLVGMNVLVQLIHYRTDYNELYGVYDKFNLNNEGNIPTFFSGIILFVSAVILAVIAKVKTGHGYRRHWVGLSVIFLYLSLDELGRMHEWIGSLFARMVGVTGMAAWYVWVVPFGILLICFAISYARFLLCMGPKHRGRIMGAGALYVGGALGMELVTAWHALNNQSDSLSHAMLTTLEETLEMAGLVVFVYALLEYLRCHAEAIQVHLVSPANHE